MCQIQKSGLSLRVGLFLNKNLAPQIFMFINEDPLFMNRKIKEARFFVKNKSTLNNEKSELNSLTQFLVE